MITQFLQDDGGQDLIEYGLLAAFVSIVSLITIKLIGEFIPPLYEKIKAALTP